MYLKKEEVNQIKIDFVNKCTRESNEDCKLIVSNNLILKSSTLPLDDIEDINSFIEKQINIFNNDRSFLFGFKIDKNDIIDLSKALASVSIYELPNELFSKYSNPSNKLYIKVTSIIINISGNINKEGFCLPAIVQIVDEDEYVIEGESISDYGELLLLSFKRNFEVKENYKSEKGVEFIYELRHNKQGRNIFSDLTVKKEFGRYKAFMNIETESHETKDEAMKQMGRWLRALGRAQEIAVVKED